MYQAWRFIVMAIVFIGIDAYSPMNIVIVIVVIMIISINDYF